MFASFKVAAKRLPDEGEWRKSTNPGEENIWHYIGSSKYGKFDGAWWEIEETEVLG